MNRVNVIIICFTTLVIFYILKMEKNEVDISPYLNKIEALEKKVDSLHTENTSLQFEADSLELRMSEYDSRIKNLNYTINVIKKETQTRLDAIDSFGDDELERFFAERYRQYKDSIN